MEYKVTGIVLTAQDYKEKDILITLFTAELGKIKCVLRGAKQPKAKLRYAGQPFCFGEWVLIKKGEYFFVTQVNVTDTFYDLATDYDNFLIATAMNEVCLELLKPGMINEQLLLNLLNALKSIVYDKINGNLVFIKFLLNTLNVNGYALNFDKCGFCNMPIMGEIMLSNNNHVFTCVSCCNNFGAPVSKREFSMLKIVNNANYSNLNTIKGTNELFITCIGLLKYNLQNILNHKFKSF